MNYDSEQKDLGLFKALSSLEDVFIFSSSHRHFSHNIFGKPRETKLWSLP